MNNDTLWLTKYKNSGEVTIETDAEVLKRLGVVNFETAEKTFYNFAMGEEKPRGIRHLKGRVKP